MKTINKYISVVVPMRNEEGNAKQLHKEIVDVVSQNNPVAEIIFVNDGSTDGTLKVLKGLRPLKIINFRKNFGQTAALDAGIKLAKGDIIITMDGDLQDDPANMPRLLEKLEEGFDIVSGWRKNRQDTFVKKIFSRGADRLRKILINDEISDSGCMLKAYRRECLEELDLYGEIRRFIPALLKIKGFKVGEIVVNHRSRIYGKTKYSTTRLLKGLVDLWSVWFWKKFSNRPLHLFGGMGLALTFVGLGLLGWMFYQRLFLGFSIGNRIWPMLGVFLIILGIQFFITGILADISIKIYYHSKKEKVYNIKEIIHND